MTMTPSTETPLDLGALSKELSGASALLGLLPEHTGYSGGVFVIDDTECGRIIKALDDAARLIPQLQAEVARLRDEESVSDLAYQLSNGLLERICLVVKGPNPENGRHSLHDLPDLVEVKFAEVARLEAGGWIPVSEKLPESGRRVLFSWINAAGNARTSTGLYAAKLSVEVSNSDWPEENLDYAEQQDVYFRPEGWWEEGLEMEECALITDRVTHWQPLPKPPGAAQ